MLPPFVVAGLLFAASVSALDSDWYAPAYTETQEAIYLLATEDVYVRPDHFSDGPTTPLQVQAQITKALEPHVQVRIMVQPGTGQQKSFVQELERIHANYPSDNITFLEVVHCDIWTRDTGPIWLKRSLGANTSTKSGTGNMTLRDVVSTRMMVQPVFTLWGYNVGGHVRGPWASCDVPNRVPQQLSPLLGIPYTSSQYATEGGDKSFNGRGSVVMNKAVELQRNPNMSLSSIEALAKEELHVRHVVWTEQGVSDDDQSFRGPLDGAGGVRVYTPIGTGGHVDEFARFVGPRTVVLARVNERQRKTSPIAAETHKRLERDYQLLLQQKDQDGQPLQVVRMPFPDELVLTVNRTESVYDQLAQLPELNLTGSTAPINIVLAASYTNYVIANDVILLPNYYKPGRPKYMLETDNQALATMQALFPDRSIVQINPEPVNAGGGGLNCITNNQPA
ncbi:hypothetical protein CYMTET_28797 [Cymbomonas tetramitiformis]|uniref:Agmatine deiminase n=1 Tax=Cymbomonas tetramitiformis TaxID=36881 RepID=A0AAE0FBJ0_9CHLO|nr:hypothetical protein CYMTET_34265 [Cymbomonas tetramitiformis]KAK3262341.1 hypothetical protein CYMTET_28797 [Cymbomonas tetramitiformis]